MVFVNGQQESNNKTLLLPPIIISHNTITDTNPSVIKYVKGGLPPIITNYPSSLIITQGHVAVFSVRVVSTNTPKYQWYKSNSLIVGATKSTYSITNVQSSDASFYSVNITNLYGITSAKVNLTVLTTNILSTCLSNYNSFVFLYWTYNLNTPALHGFKIYDGVASRDYTNTTQFGLVTNGVVSNLTKGVTYYFTATAKDTNGLESPYSNEINCNLSSIDTNFSLSIVIISNTPRIQTKICPYQPITIYWSNNLKTWKQLTTNLESDVYGNVIYDDKSASQYTNRFYKATSP